MSGPDIKCIKLQIISLSSSLSLSGTLTLFLLFVLEASLLFTNVGTSCTFCSDKDQGLKMINSRPRHSMHQGTNNLSLSIYLYLSRARYDKCSQMPLRDPVSKYCRIQIRIRVSKVSWFRIRSYHQGLNEFELILQHF